MTLFMVGLAGELVTVVIAAIVDNKNPSMEPEAHQRLVEVTMGFIVFFMLFALIGAML